MLKRCESRLLQALVPRRTSVYLHFINRLYISTCQTQKHFGINYADCKSKFVANSSIICSHSNTHNQYEIPLMKLRAADIHPSTDTRSANDPLAVDITIINEKNTTSDHLILHISGMHGAEGYTGSSIQNCFLHELSNETDPNINNLPVIILVHGLNPYGFHLGRRFNSNNVDLNRNLKTEQEWNKYVNDDPNFAGYVTFDALFNPSINVEVFATKQPFLIQYLYKKWIRHSYWPRCIYNAIRFGIPKLGAAATAGQCHKQKGVFYVGNGKHELEHVKLQQFISDRFQANVHWKQQFNKITLIDIHTGVGASGMDSLYSDHPVEFERMKALFPTHAKSNNIELLSDDANKGSKDSLQGAFQYATGFSHNYRDVFYDQMENECDFIGVTQEFGTYHKMRVFQALREENAVYQAYLELLESGEYKDDDDTLSDLREYVVESHDFVKQIFYVDTSKWKTSVVQRGMDLLHTVIKR